MMVITTTTTTTRRRRTWRGNVRARAIYRRSSRCSRGETRVFERLDTDAPVLKTSTGKTYEGYYERTIGEALLVEPADKSCVSYASPRSGKKRVVLKANGGGRGR